MLLLLCFALPAPAEQVKPATINLLLSGNSRLYYDAVDGFEDRLNETGFRFETRVITGVEEKGRDELYSGADYVVAIGSKAARQLINSPPTVPAISILVPQQAYQSLMANQGSTIDRYASLSVVYLDQPVSRLMALTRIVMSGRGEKVGILFGPSSEKLRDKYLQASRTQSLSLIDDMQDTEKASLDAIETLVRQTDAYLAVYDRKTLNRKTAKWLLYLANVYKKPVIAYSKSYVDAGALAAVYTSPYEAGGLAANWLKENTKTNNNSKWRRYPGQFTVSINRKIASKLELVLEEPSEIASMIRKLEVQLD